MNRIKQILSFVWPFSQKINTTYNGVVELNWINGKKRLDSKDANYSYGQMQQVFSFGLAQINFSHVKNALLLGLGGGCVIDVLRKECNFSDKITAVEIDETIIKIAEDDFGKIEKKDQEIICADAFTFALENIENYDLVIVDLFINTIVPQQFYGIEFWSALIKKTSPKGYILFNAGIELNSKSMLNNIIDHFNEQVIFKTYNQVEGMNTLLLGQKK